ncbi:MAG: hypothetical protein HOO93_11300 [Methyloglobulus sp.]|nr:hypothetical protein [Methyloglobulus sp.]
MLLLSPRPLKRFKPLWLRLPIVGLSLLSPGLSQGADWSLKANVDQSLGYDDNVRMVRQGQPSQGPQGSFKYMLVPVLSFLHNTDVSEIRATVSYGTQIYTDIPQFNQDIQNYGLSGLYKTKNFDWGITTKYSITPSRNTAAQDSGNFNNNSDRNSWTVSPSISYKIDEVNSLMVSPSYSETSYTTTASSSGGTDPNTNFRNNTTFNLNLGWQRVWTERYKSTAGLFYSMYEAQQTQTSQPSGQGSVGPTSFDSVGINYSNVYEWSENWNLLGTVGIRHTESNSNGNGNGNGNGNKSSSFGFLADVGVNYSGENFSSGLHLSRSLNPSSQGQLQEQTSIGLNFSYRIIERLSTSFAANYQESTLVNSISSSARKNIVIQPSISWQLTPELALGGSYRYRFQDGSTNNSIIVANGVAESNLFMLTLNYNWQGFKLSR